MNILVIDTDSKNIRVGIKINGKSKYISSNAKVLKAQAVLPLIDKVLKIILTYQILNKVIQDPFFYRTSVRFQL